MSIPCSSEHSEVKPLTGLEPEREPTTAEIQEEIRKYLRLLPHIAEPNLARVREIREQIQNGTYLTRELVEEAADRLALRFLRKE